LITVVKEPVVLQRLVQLQKTLMEMETLQQTPVNKEGMKTQEVVTLVQMDLIIVVEVAMVETQITK
jgi:hypothetical protein